MQPSAVEQRERTLKAITLARHTERTVTRVTALRGALAEIHRASACVSVDELVGGAAGVMAASAQRPHGASDTHQLRRPS